MPFTTTIKQIAWEMKMEDLKEQGFFLEYKEKKDFWITRFNNLKVPCEGVFLIGNTEVHRVTVVEKGTIASSDLPEKYGTYVKGDELFYFKCQDLQKST